MNMIGKRYFKTALVATALLISSMYMSCVKRSKDTVGPLYYSAPAGFSVLSFTVTDNVDFTASQDTIKATFSDKVTWTATYKGLSSGATRTFTSSSQTIDATNGGLWNGGHSGLYFFRTGEQVEVTLSFLGSSITVKDTITIAQAKQFTNFTDVLVVATDPGAVAASEGYEGSFPTFFAGGGWIAFTDAGERTLGEAKDTLGSVQGTKAASFRGTDVNNSYFICGVKRTLTAPEKAFLNHSASDIYINVYLWGNGNMQNRMAMVFEEADNDGLPATHEPAGDDAFEYQFNMGHTGWKLFTIKYSDLVPGSNPSFGGNGNKIPEPATVQNIGFNVLSNPNGGNVNVYYDFPVITIGGAFDPSK